MKKLFSHIDYTRIGHFQSILEQQGFRTFVKNLDASVGMGEIPYTEIWPELWLYEDSEYEEAAALIDQLRNGLERTVEPWTCPACGTVVEDGFEECWNCGAASPRYS